MNLEMEKDVIRRLHILANEVNDNTVYMLHGFDNLGGGIFGAYDPNTKKVALNRNCKNLFGSWYHLYETICHESTHDIADSRNMKDVEVTSTGKQIHTDNFKMIMKDNYNLNVTHEGGGCDMRENFAVAKVCYSIMNRPEGDEFYKLKELFLEHIYKPTTEEQKKGAKQEAADNPDDKNREDDNSGKDNANNDTNNDNNANNDTNNDNSNNANNDINNANNDINNANNANSNNDTNNANSNNDINNDNNDNDSNNDINNDTVTVEVTSLTKEDQAGAVLW